MPQFDAGVMREIHSRVDLATFIGQYVSLKKRGNDLVGLCPFHGEKSPSFHVHPDRGFFKCFGCGVGGDVITFVQKFENTTFPDAVRILAAKAGVELAAENPGATRARNEREAIYEANTVAAAFFARMLRDAVGEGARAYCERRGISASSIERFNLGFAPDAWNALTDELQANGIDLRVAERAGLLKPSQRGGFYDFYRNRLMIPTYAATTGEVIAFGGRELGSGEPKYLNTGQTPVYTKGEHLYALNVARRASANERALIVVEGYLDCIALHQAGFDNTVAALGTAFTDKQAAELHKYADGVFLCYDADSAGQAAATKAIDIASKSIEYTGSSVRIVVLPEGDDPDSFVRERGPEAFQALLDASPPAIQYKLDAHVNALARGFESPASINRKAESLVRELTPREEWDRWRVYVAGRLKVNVDDLRNSRFLANASNFAPRVPGPSASPGARYVPVHSQPARAESASFEREVLTIVLEDPNLAREYRERIPSARFRSELYRRTYDRIMAMGDDARDTAAIFAAFADDDEAIALLSTLGSRDRSSAVRYENSDQRREHLNRVVERLARDKREVEYHQLDRALNELIEAGKPVPPQLLAEFEAVKTQLKKK